VNANPLDTRSTTQMNRYAANLLLEYAVRVLPAARPLCDRRIVVFHAAGARAAIRRAKQLGRSAQYQYRNADGHTVQVKPIGLIDVLDIDFAGPEEVYYSMRRTANPKRDVRSNAELSVSEGPLKGIGSSWWAVPAFHGQAAVRG
jgi:hypothetical protein